MRSTMKDRHGPKPQTKTFARRLGWLLLGAASLASFGACASIAGLNDYAEGDGADAGVGLSSDAFAPGAGKDATDLNASPGSDADDAMTPALGDDAGDDATGGGDDGDDGAASDDGGGFGLPDRRRERRQLRRRHQRSKELRYVRPRVHDLRGPRDRGLREQRLHLCVQQRVQHLRFGVRQRAVRSGQLRRLRLRLRDRHHVQRRTMHGELDECVLLRDQPCACAGLRLQSPLLPLHRRQRLQQQRPERGRQRRLQQRALQRRQVQWRAEHGLVGVLRRGDHVQPRRHAGVSGQDRVRGQSRRLRRRRAVLLVHERQRLPREREMRQRRDAEPVQRPGALHGVWLELRRHALPARQAGHTSLRSAVLVRCRQLRRRHRGHRHMRRSRNAVLVHRRRAVPERGLRQLGGLRCRRVHRLGRDRRLQLRPVRSGARSSRTFVARRRDRAKRRRPTRARRVLAAMLSL